MPWGPVAGALVSVVAGEVLGDDGGGAMVAQSAVSDAATGKAIESQTKISEDLYKHWKTSFKPLEVDLTKDAKGFGSKKEQREAAGIAHTDVAMAFDRQRDAAERSMASYGIDPGAGRARETRLRTNLAEARADAYAQNTARKGVRDAAFAKELDVIQIGKGMPATASAGFLGAANASAAQANAQFNRGQYLQQNAAQGMAPFVSMAQQGVKRWFNTGSNPNYDSSGNFTPQYTGGTPSDPYYG